MFGRVNQNREAVIKLVIVGVESRKIAIDAVIDTAKMYWWAMPTLHINQSLI
jgi:hypothetical protein